jgi:hypothetical protein
VLGKTPHYREQVLLRLGDRDEEIAVESPEGRYLVAINRFNGAILGKTESVSDAGLEAAI